MQQLDIDEWIEYFEKELKDHENKKNKAYANKDLDLYYEKIIICCGLQYQLDLLKKIKNQKKES